MYCVSETKSTSDERIICNVASEHEFIQTVNDMICKFTGFSDIESISLNGFSVIYEHYKISLTESTTNVGRGYFGLYNTTQTVDQTVFIWKLLSYDVSKQNTMALSKFSMETMCSYPSIGVIGCNPIGRSNMIIDLVNTRLNQYSDILVISPNTQYQSLFSTNNNNATIVQLYSYDRNAIMNYLTRAVHYLEQNMPFCGCLILDDCLTKEIMRNDEVRQLMLNSRHYRLSLIIGTTSSGSLTCMPPEMRHNFDYVFYTPENFKNVYNQYFSMFPSFKSFQENCIDRYYLDDASSTIVIDNRVKSNEIQKKVFFK